MSSPLFAAVLLGHGSREPSTEVEIRDLAAAMGSISPEWRFTHAFLNQEPKLDSAVDALATAGATRIKVLPLLVFTGKHILEDVPQEIEHLRARHPAITFELVPHLSRLSGFTGMLADVLNESAPQSFKESA
jgi:sirohydrochlorin cobaltochelatase